MSKNLSVDETLRWLEYFGRMADAAQEVHPSDVLTRAAELIADRSMLRTALAELVALAESPVDTPFELVEFEKRLADYRARRAAALTQAKAAMEATA